MLSGGTLTLLGAIRGRIMPNSFVYRFSGLGRIDSA
jgi:hypothetical protein